MYQVKFSFYLQTLIHCLPFTLFMPGRYSGVSHDEFGEKYHTKLLKLYGEANVVFSGETA
jgi:hypothetical protein